MSKINEKVMVVANDGSRKPRQATWWLLDGQWKCVGATRPLSDFCQWVSPEDAARLAKSQGYRFSWVERHNKNNPGTLHINPSKLTETAGSLLQGEQSNQRGSLNTHTDEGAETTHPDRCRVIPGLVTEACNQDGTKWPARAEHPVKAL